VEIATVKCSQHFGQVKPMSEYWSDYVSIEDLNFKLENIDELEEQRIADTISGDLMRDER